MGVWKCTALQTHDFTALHWPVRPFLTSLLHLFWNTGVWPELVCIDWLQKSFRAGERRRAPAFLSLNVSGLVTVSHLSLIGISTISFSFGLSGSKTVRLNPFWLPLTAETHCSHSHQSIQLKLHNAVFKYIWFQFN